LFLLAVASGPCSNDDSAWSITIPQSSHVTSPTKTPSNPFKSNKNPSSLKPTHSINSIEPKMTMTPKTTTTTTINPPNSVQTESILPTLPPSRALTNSQESIVYYMTSKINMILLSTLIGIGMMTVMSM